MKLNGENIKKLIENKEKLLLYAGKIKEKFDGPSAYFYGKVIDKVKKSKKDHSYPSLFDDLGFMEYLYATLASWGMHRMDRNTRMLDFDEFKTNINSNKERFIKLSNKNIKENSLDGLKEDILILFNSIRVMRRDDAPKLVANSKIMHFLLPDLIPPIDKGNVCYFFYGRRNKRDKKYTPKIKDENDTFWEILTIFKEMSEKLSDDDLKNEWDTSVPKLIDNAIIGWNMEGN